MTDKQIIVDGVDVNGCNFRLKREDKILCECCHATGFGVICECEKWKTCDYKNYKRKEQECEKLEVEKNKLLSRCIDKQCRINDLVRTASKKECILKVNGKKYTNLSGIDKAKLFINGEISIRNKKILELENFISGLQWKFYENCKQVCDAQSELKAEREKNKPTEEICPHCDTAVELPPYKGIYECPSCGKLIVCCSACEEQNCSNCKYRIDEELKAEREKVKILKQYKASKQASYESMQREWNEAVNENRELKQTLAEIKEIVEKTLNMVDYKTYFKRDNKSLKQEGFKAVDQILQKISEVVDDNI